MGTSPRPTRREKARTATIDEIKLTALNQMREQGTVDIRFADIARAMEMTPPALYRYFADRDELLSALITDSYDDLGRFVAEARDAVPADDVGGRFIAIALAYRQWARQAPQQFALILGLPVAGYAAPVDGPTTEAAQRAMSQMSALFLEAIDRGELAPPRLRDVHPAIAACAAEKNARQDRAVSPETFQAMLHAWSTLHGFAALEAFGHFDWLGEPGRDALFDGYARLAAETAGMPAPKAS